jgi:hypothetical protein
VAFVVIEVPGLVVRRFRGAGLGEQGRLPVEAVDDPIGRRLRSGQGGEGGEDVERRPDPITDDARRYAALRPDDAR